MAEVDGGQFITITREEISDMFKVLADKRQVLSAWKEITNTVSNFSTSKLRFNLASANFFKDK